MRRSSTPTKYDSFRWDFGSKLFRIDTDEILRQLKATTMENGTRASTISASRDSYQPKPRLHTANYSTDACYHRRVPELAADQIKSHIESRWSELERLFDEAVKITNATFQQRRLPILVRTTSKPGWESCLGMPSDDIVDDGYYCIRWKLAIPTIQYCEDHKSIVSEIRHKELRTALHRFFFDDCLFVEWGIGDWARQALVDASAKETAGTIARLMRWEVMQLDCLPELKPYPCA